MYLSKVNLKKNKMKKLLVALLLGITTISMAQKKALLRLNYEKGDKYEVSMKMKQDMGVALMDMNMKMGMDVTEASDEAYNVENKFIYISTKIVKDGVEKVNYNSNMKEGELNEEGKKFRSQMQPMMDAVIFSEVNRLGESKVVKVEPNMPGVDQMANQSNRSVVYPEEAVEVGSTWTNTQSNQGMNMELTYKITEITSNRVFADLTGKMSLVPAAEITGKIEIDRSTGVPFKTIMSIKMDMMGQQINNTTEATITRL